jgi:hypothetical protein
MFKTLCISLWLFLHPVHVTLTSIDFISDPGCFSVFVKMYFDDFLLDFKLNGGDTENSDFSVYTSFSRAVTEKYLRDKLLIKVNEKLLSGKLKDMKVADNEISMNLEYDGGKNPKTIIVKSLIMTNLYPDQSNMIIVKVKDFEEGVKLTSDQTERTFKIK